jgi:hypothetical protein
MSGKSLGFIYESCWVSYMRVVGFHISELLALGVVPGDSTEVWGIYI